MSDYGGSNTPAEHKDTWQTPPELFAAINAEFSFQLDAAASERNALCRNFITEEQDTLVTPWSDYVAIGYAWMNPPYSNPLPFVQKAAHEAEVNNIGCVMLLPADQSVGWFKEAIKTASEVRCITGGRLSFISSQSGKPVGGNTKGSMLIIWRPYPRTQLIGTFVDKNTLMNFGAKLIARAA
ncbi:phage N-6-adenine-methyltransferase [Rouxiella sp. Mn2063]|uniref:phage N-6-adenine-methyltransferase n=1 Tax=Rouxiella sp. Mn2063 TaxID=3395262 RepID=UPI003BC208BE